MRTHAPSSISDPEQLKGQIRAELKEELIGEMKKEILEQLKTLSTSVVAEVRAQLSGQTQPGTVTSASPVCQRWPAQIPSYQWDMQGQPIFCNCGVAGHIQRQCPCMFPPPQDF